MPRTRRPKSSLEKVQPCARRKPQRPGLRQKGLHSVQIGVTDVHSRAFAAEAHRQSLAVANSPHEAEDQAFVDAISEWNDE